MEHNPLRSWLGGLGIVYKGHGACVPEIDHPHLTKPTNLYPGDINSSLTSNVTITQLALQHVDLKGQNITKTSTFETKEYEKFIKKGRNK